MDSKFFQEVQTVDERDVYVRDIDTLINSLYATGEESFDQLVTTKVSAPVSKTLAYISPDLEERKRVLEGLSNELKSWPVVSLTLAFIPTPRQIREIVGELRQEFAPNAVLRWSWDPNIIGGAIIDFQGKYADFSVRKKLENYAIVPTIS